MRQHGFRPHSQRKPVLVDEGIGNYNVLQTKWDALAEQ